MKRIRLAFLILFSLLVSDSWAEGLTPREDSDRFKSESVSNSVVPQQRVHRRGNINYCVTNWGMLGSEAGQVFESSGCLFCDHPDSEVAAPSFEFPSNSGLEYLFHGVVWIGGVVDGETLVTVGVDPYGWSWDFEFWPSSNIREREWLGDQECITSFADTFIRPEGDIHIPDPEYPDGRPHKPLNVEIFQHTYSWQSSPFEEFTIVDYIIRNIGGKAISEVYLGFLMDTDIMHISENPYGEEIGCQDDITGFLENYVDSSGETTEVNIAWAADNNGQPHGGVFTELSPAGVIGIKLLSCSNPDPKISYNWYFTDSQGYPVDWGPWLKSNQAKWKERNPYGSGIYFPDGAMGTPHGDRSKYFILSNGEIDFDQIYTDTLPRVDTCWIPADSQFSKNFADGIDIRFVYSFGPFDLPPDDTIFAAVALMAGDNFHVDPYNGRENLPNKPYVYYENLDFSDLVYNAQKAQEVYESGYTLPPPGPPENFSAFTMKGNTVRLIWTHKNHPNLKGYNIYRSMSSDGPTPKKINSEIITVRLYIDEGLIEGKYYNYWIASVNQNDQEGKRSSIKVLAGRPRVPSGLKAESSKDQVRLSWYPSGERDIARYNIYRTEYDSLRLVDSVGLVTNYVDRTVINGVIYYYKITAVDSLSLESFFSDSAYALCMAFDMGIGIFDRTRPYYYSKFEPQDFGCSVDSMYKRIFQEITTQWDYLTHDDRKTNWDISLQDLSPYPVILIHSDNLQGNQDWGSEHSTAFIIRHYLRAGGKLILEGTNNNVFFFWDAEVRTDSPEAEFCDPGYIKRHDSLFCEYLFLDKAYFPLWTSKNRTEEFVGAFSKATEYPHLEVDSERVDRWYYSGSSQSPVQGKLPGIGYLVPKDTSVYPVEVIYTFHSAYDTSDLAGKPVAIRYLGDDYKFVFFNFPLYFIKEEQAIQVLRQALSDMGVPTGVEEESEEEISTGGFSLKQNYPNPFNAATTIPFTIPSPPVNSSQFMVHGPPTITLSIYNILGRKVRTLLNEEKLPGQYRVSWDGRDEKGNEVGSGVYLYKMKAGDYEQTKKMVLLK